MKDHILPKIVKYDIEGNGVSYQWKNFNGVWSSNPYDDLVFCFTGKLSYSRSLMESFAIKSGASVTKSVSKKTTHLVAYDPNQMSSKTRKAIDYGVTIISESKFLDMCSVIKTNTSHEDDISNPPTKKKKRTSDVKKKKYSAKRRIQL